ncbi:MAG: c-type cytochrome [Roseiflexus sp.]
MMRRPVVDVLLLWLFLLAGCSVVADRLAPERSNSTVPTTSPSPMAQPVGDPQRGAAIFAGDVAIAGFVACRGCHSVDPAAGDGIGPNLAGIALRAGSRIPGVSADDYIRRSILVHDDFVVPGFEAGLARGVVGRDFAEILSTQDVTDLTAYLLTLDQAIVAQVPTILPSPTSSPTLSPTQLLPTASEAATPSPTLSATVASSPSPTRSATVESSPGSVLSPTLPASPSPDNEDSTAPRATNTLSTPQGTPDTATVSPTAATPTIPPSPTDTATPTAAPTPTQPSLPPATTPVVDQEEEIPEELRVFEGCMTCHNQHEPSIVRMPHVRFPRCSACHSGSPSRIGCPTCHSMHRIQAPHGGENPNLPCSHCHTDR